MSLLIENARLLTLAGPRPRTGRELSELSVISRGHVLVRDGLIAAVGPGRLADVPDGTTVIDADGRVLMPGFVDAHTHACWAGDRLDEWEQKQAGATYLEILEAGGGIMSTVRHTREASEDELTTALVERLAAMRRGGTTSVEVKSGYGLTTQAELTMLRAIRRAGELSPVTVTPTACIAHAIDPDHAGGRDGFLREVREDTLPAVAEEFPGIALDAYCENGAWSLEEVVGLYERAAELGHPLRVHSDQFNELGMTEWALEHGVRSVDHLEATSPPLLDTLARSDCYGVILPCSGFHVDGRYADARRFVDAGGRLVLGTNYNPGSSPCHSMPMAIALAVRELKLTAAEAIVASTLNAAELLGHDDRGSLQPGLRADLVLLRHRDERQLGYEFGSDPVLACWCGGEPDPSLLETLSA
ncbi:MAG: imidazolonepropionase [Acidobacteriota bacterium]